MQLHTPGIRKAFQVLQLCGSSYCEPLNRATEAVENASKEAASNTACLETLRKHIQVQIPSNYQCVYNTALCSLGRCEICPAPG